MANLANDKFGNGKLGNWRIWQMANLAIGKLSKWQIQQLAKAIGG